jgi:nucleotide-binding universal stress UspA family protein
MAERQRKLRVLWATDGSEDADSAIPILKELILPAAESLTVMTVAPHSFLSGARPDPAFLTRIRPAAKRQALTESEQLAREEATRLDPPSIKVEALARWGNPIEEILRLSRTMPADLVVMGAKGHSNLGLLLLGSVSQGVVQHATRPVLIARPPSGGVKRVLIGYEPTPPARKAIQFMEQLGLPTSVEFVLSHVLEPFGVPTGTPISYRTRALEEVHRINERRHRTAERALTVASEALSKTGRSVATEILTGAAGPVLEESAKDREAGLIVVGSRKPSPARHYLLGSTAEKLVRHAPMSVLVVR